MPIDLSKPLDDSSIGSNEKEFMENLQANILKGHGREQVVLMFLSIDDIDLARTFFKHYDVLTAAKQLEETERFHRTGKPGGLVQLAFISQAGLQKFGHANLVNDQPFAEGMDRDTAVLDNGTTDSWQTEFKTKADVLLLIAHDEFDKVVSRVSEIKATIGQAFTINVIQQGVAYRNLTGEGIEHFGYVDGRSQPLFLTSQIQREGDLSNYDPSSPLDQFLFPDPLFAEGFGSLFVFRKLEQNVAGFKEQEEKLGSALNLRGADEERAGAMVVGRFEDGTPLTLGDRAGGGPVTNNFNYDADAAGSKCPFQGHIRKTNPRGSSPGGLEFDKGVQMARRGITYGSRLQHPVTKQFVDEPSEGVGLLFMSYQKSIAQQFRFMQTSWANNEGFPQANIGIDPVIGTGSNADQTWFPTYADINGTHPSHFSGFVTLKGGEYFYAPSPQGLKNL